MTTIETAGIHHLRLTVTNLERSRAFYGDVLGFEIAIDSQGDPSDPEVRSDQAKLYGGVVFKPNLLDLGGGWWGLSWGFARRSRRRLCLPARQGEGD
jgi:catechol 2,3-dioxygenase-like lactoylglutathione lyase family enzyme